MRKTTGNRYSLDDVLLAIGKTGASDQYHWPIERALEVAEHAGSTQVLPEQVFERLAKKPGTVEPTRPFFALLGVRPQADSVVFDERAPLAKRQAVAARRPG